MVPDDGFPRSIPLVLGVIGHRELPPELARLADVFIAFLDRLRARLPDTPIVVLSSLAEGADRLLARLVMDRLGAQLIAVLPMPSAAYVRDFASEPSQREFESLLSKARRTNIVGPDPDAAGAPESRGDCYARAGAFIVEHSHVLVALWDGEPGRGFGGTADVVGWWRQGVVPKRLSTAHPSRLLPIEVRPLVWLQASTNGVTIAPDMSADDLAWGALDRLDGLNRDIRMLVATQGEAALTASTAALRADPEVRCEPCSAEILTRYAAADAAALTLQHRERWLTDAIYGTFAIVVLLYGLMDWIAAFVTFHVAVIPIMAVLVWWIRRRRVEARALDYRALAEGLRVLFFWRQSGLSDGVSGSYLHRHLGVISWIRQAIAAVEVLAGPPTGASDRRGIEMWIGGQRRYLTARRAWAARLSTRFARAVAVCFGATFAVATGYAAASLVAVAQGHGWAGEQGPVDQWFQGALGLFGSLTVALEAYRQRRAFDALERQYALAERVFRVAAEQLEDPVQSLPEVLRTLGREALAENAEWLWARRAQPLDVPRG